MTRIRKAKFFFLVRVGWCIGIAIPMFYYCYLGISSLKNIPTLTILPLSILILITSWVISFYVAKRGFLRNLEINKTREVINIETSEWNLQKPEIVSTKDADESRNEKILRIGRSLIYLVPAVVSIYFRGLFWDQKIILNVMITGTVIVLMISLSGLSAGLARAVFEIESDLNGPIRIRPLA
jgi:hypothetical protein